MDLTIEVTPTELAEILTAANQHGLAPAEFVKRIVKEHLPVVDVSKEDVYAKLRERQVADNVQLLPDRSAMELFAQWAEEDAQMTDEEREENERIFGEIEKKGIPRTQI